MSLSRRPSSGLASTGGSEAVAAGPLALALHARTSRAVGCGCQGGEPSLLFYKVQQGSRG